MISRKRALRVRRIEMLEKKVFNGSGFLRLWSVKLRNRYTDGSVSREYSCNMVHRKGTDCVAIIPYFFDEKKKLKIYLNRGVRPAIFFRKMLHPPIHDRTDNRYSYEAM